MKNEQRNMIYNFSDTDIQILAHTPALVGKYYFLCNTNCHKGHRNYGLHKNMFTDGRQANSYTPGE